MVLTLLPLLIDSNKHDRMSQGEPWIRNIVFPPETSSEAVSSVPMHASYYACVIKMDSSVCGQFYIPRENRESTLSEKEQEDDDR
jgi:hypothetical protein